MAGPKPNEGSSTAGTSVDSAAPHKSAQCLKIESARPVVQIVQLEKQGDDFGGLLTSLAGPLVALFAVFAVHVLTQRRDKEKAILELHKVVGEGIAKLLPLAVSVWEEEEDAKRRPLIDDVNWTLQQIGAQVERVRRISRRRTLRFKSWEFKWVDEISLAQAMATLRDGVTNDPFDDPERGSIKGKRWEIERHLGSFLAAFDGQLCDWLE